MLIERGTENSSRCFLCLNSHQFELRCTSFMHTWLHWTYQDVYTSHSSQCLTQVEEMLISAVLPIMSLYYRLPHGQYGYSGHVINLPHYVGSFGNSLLRLPSELDIIVVRKEGATQSHRDFRVRRSVVLRVLQCMAASN